MTLIEDFVRIGLLPAHHSRMRDPLPLCVWVPRIWTIFHGVCHSQGLKMSHGPKITTNVLKMYILLMESARIRHDMGFWAAAPPAPGLKIARQRPVPPA